MKAWLEGDWSERSTAGHILGQLADRRLFHKWRERTLSLFRQQRGTEKLSQSGHHHKTDIGQPDGCPKRAAQRDSLAAHLEEKGVEALISWTKPMHHHETLNLGHFSLPETESLCNEVLSLPMHPDLDDDDIEYVIATVREFY